MARGDRIRRGMLIKNISEEPLTISMETRDLHMEPGEVTIVKPDEVLDSTFRHHLQVRSVTIVRPATKEDEEEHFDNGGSATAADGTST